MTAAARITQDPLGAVATDAEGAQEEQYGEAGPSAPLPSVSPETKTSEQQSCLLLHRTRQLFIRHLTSVINAIRAHMAELGIIAPVGRKGVEQLLDVVADAHDRRVPEIASGCIAALGAQLRRRQP